jgi:phosphoribosylformylglycinamidine synthase
LDLAAALSGHWQVANRIRQGQVLAAHDVSDGGVGVALAEMCIASGLGAELLWEDAGAIGLFDEVAAAYVLEMPPGAAAESGFPIIGRVISEPELRIKTPTESVKVAIRDLDAAWRLPLSMNGGQS